ncbi:transposase [Paenibacillus terrae]|uniref:Transposase n=2 Tax=Paenibacillus terrae TaxID=159743 RepID=A0A0D7WWG2_9BACL|nr:transposase [Paenibacillus terrae]
MCSVLQISKSTYYYEAKERRNEDDITAHIVEIFKKNLKTYGTRKIKSKLYERGVIASRRRIGRIMKAQGLGSTYTVAQYKPHKSETNHSQQPNELDREFQQSEAKRVVVSDLTYVKVKNRWHYICILVDLFNREIIGSSVGPNKDVGLVARAFASVQGDLRQVQLFHTDRGREFKNKSIDETLATFQISRSLSMKGCPYDNAVAKATFKIMKTEFIHQMHFQSLNHLTLELNDYANRYNKYRIHGTLSYMSPVNYRESALKKVV